MAALLTTLEPLVRRLRSDGYVVVGPTARDGAIVLAEIEHASDLPHGWGVSTGPGVYRITRREDGAAFAHSAGPQAWKRFLHPPREQLGSATRDGEDVRFSEPEPPDVRYAFLGVRACDLRAIAVQDRVLGRWRPVRAAAGPGVPHRGELHRTQRDLFLCLSWGRPSRRGRVRPGAHRARRPGLRAPVRGRGRLAGRPAAARRASARDRRHRARDPGGRPGARRRRTGWAGRCPTSTCARCWSPHWRPTAGTTWRPAASPAATAPWRARPASAPRSPTPPTSPATTPSAGSTGRPASRPTSPTCTADRCGATIRSRYRQWLTHKLGTWHDQFGSPAAWAAAGASSGARSASTSRRRRRR